MKIKQTLIEGGTKKDQNKKKTTLTVIIATACLLAIALIFLLVFTIVTAIANKQPDEEETPVANIGATEVITLAEAQLYEGTLLTLDDEHPYMGSANMVLMKDIERPQTVGGTNAYTIGGMSTLCGTAESIRALNSMIEGFYKATHDDNIYVANAHNSEAGAAQDAVYVSGNAFELKYFSAAESEDWSKKDTIYGVEIYKWIYNNAHKYGFITMSAEGEGSNVFRFVGTVHATAIKNGNLTFNSYIESVRSATPETPLTVLVGGSVYGVYYLGPESGHKVPVNYAYTISGDNLGGYIITVKTSK